ncbi:DUF695 domain-containing protein [Massilia sp. 9096]|uniref:DUF695 domain-containing protein n=1 Tax=Massilia sp. 9096 TaxID=1500894 RepID=UPI0018CC9C43|nr:DUF695 domain-containing protein [Massilia sp. 9096]
MWPFKKHLPIDDLNEDEELWSVMRASTADGPMLVRINTTAKRWSKHPSLGIRVGFAIPFEHPNFDEGSFSSENAVLNQMEEKILSYLKLSGPAIHVLTITTGTFKEFVFHIQNGGSVAGIHERLRVETTSHDVQCIAVRDPEWTVYASFSK